MAIRSLKASNLNLEAKGFNGQQQTGIFIRGADATRERNIGFWERNPNWLTLPTVTASEQKIVGLFAVTRHFPHATVLVSGNYTVDWGDGSSSVNYTAGFQAHKRYIYDDLSNSTLIQDPILGDYKQVIVTITAQAGQNLTSVNFAVYPSYTLGYSSRPPNNWLELVVAGPNITTLLIGSQNSTSATPQQNFPFLEQVTVLSNNLTTGGRFLLSNLNALQSVPILNTNTWTSLQGLFQNSKRLRYVGPLDGRRATSAANMFDGCSNLVEAPIIDFVSSNTATTSSCTNMSAMFQNCSNLQNIPYYNTGGVSTFQNMFLGCTALKRVPDFEFSFPNGITGINLSGMFSACYSLEELPQSNTVFVSDMSSYASQCFNLRKVPYYNYSNVTTLASAYNGCYNVKEFPDFDTTFKCTSFNSLHNSNYSLTKVGRYEVANATTLTSTWQGCRNLVYPPVFTFNGQLNIVPKIIDYSFMFSGCSSLLYGPTIDTSNVRTRTAGTIGLVGVNQMFADCLSLRKIGPYNFMAVTTFTDFAFSATYLTDMDISFPDFGVAATLGTHGSNYFFPTGAARGGVSNLVIRHINTSFSVACTSIGMDCINDLFRNLGKGAGSATITVSSTFVSNAQFGQTTTTNFSRSNGSNALYGGSTTGILVGQSVTGGNLGYLRFQTCFADGPNNTITLENHGMPANSNIYPPVLISRGIKSFGVIGSQCSNTRIHPSGNTIPRQWMTLRRANGIFMTVAAKSNVSAWSTDGYTWNNSYLPAEQVWVEVAYGANTWVAVANRRGVSDLSSETTNAAAYSTDNGITWNHCNLPANGNWVSVAYGNGVFVAIQGGIWGLTHSAIATSTNGINWTLRSNPFGTALQSNVVKWVNDRFYVLLGTSTTQSFNRYSFDGINWFQSTGFPSGYWKDITYYDGVYSAFSGGGFSSTVAAISVDGHLWLTTTSPFSIPWSRLEWGGGEFVAIGGASSPGSGIGNCSHFAARAGWSYTAVLPNDNSGSNQYWQGLAYDENTSRFVMLGGGNYALSGAGQVIALGTSATSNVVAHMNLCSQVESLSKGYNGTVFYARDITENTFKLSVTKGGPVWNIGNASSNGCSSNTEQFIRLGTVVKEVTNSTQVILSSPSFSTAAVVSTTFKSNADYVIAAMKGWTVLG